MVADPVATVLGRAGWVWLSSPAPATDDSSVPPAGMASTLPHATVAGRRDGGPRATVAGRRGSVELSSLEGSGRTVHSMLTAPLMALERILMPNLADLSGFSTENVTPSHVVAAFGDGVLTLSALMATGSGRPLQIDIIDASSYISQPPALKVDWGIPFSPVDCSCGEVPSPLRLGLFSHH